MGQKMMKTNNKWLKINENCRLTMKTRYIVLKCLFRLQPIRTECLMCKPVYLKLFLALSNRCLSIIRLITNTKELLCTKQPEQG